MNNTNKNGIKVAFFDLDGTLIDTDKRLSDEVTVAMKRLGTNISEKEAIESKRDWYELANKYGHSKEDLDRAFSYKDLGTWQDAIENGEVRLYNETRRILDSLVDNGVNLGLISKSTRASDANYKIDHFDLRKYFGDNISLVGLEDGKTKEALNLLNKIQNPINDAYFIGDREEDVEIAENIKSNVNYNVHGLLLNRQGIFSNVKNCVSVKDLEEALRVIL